MTPEDKLKVAAAAFRDALREARRSPKASQKAADHIDAALLWALHG
jgi:hypothetical protein